MVCRNIFALVLDTRGSGTAGTVRVWGELNSYLLESITARINNIAV